MLFFSMVWLLDLVHTTADKAIYDNRGPISVQSSNAPGQFILMSNLLFSLSSLNYCAADCTALSVPLIFVKKQSVGHWTSSPSTSKHPNQPVPGASFAFFLWVAHILSPQWSLFQLWNKRLYQTPRYSGCLCRSHPWQGQRAEMRESYHMCKMSLNSCPLYSAASFIKCALKKCDPTWKKSCSYHMRWLKSKANTPTGVYTKTDDYRTQGLASTT